MRQRVFFVGRWFTNFALVFLAIEDLVKPEDAMSNLSGWATLLHLPDPTWLQSSTADRVLFWVAVSGVIVLWGGPVAWHQRRVLFHWNPNKKASSLTAAKLEAKIAENPDLSELLLTALREGLKSQDILVEEGIRPSIKLKFMRWRGFYLFFSKPPFSFYWAKRRVEFIDAWTWFFH